MNTIKPHKYIDAHMHINLAASKPIDDFLCNYHQCLMGCNLIINSWKEFEIYNKLKDNISDSVFITFLVDKNNYFSGKEIKELLFNGKKCGIKIHPRLSNITENDIEWYIKECQNNNTTVIMVDDFHYGNYMHNNIELKIISAIANSCPDKKVVVAHSGGFNLLHDVMYTKTYSNVYYDISETINYFKYSSIEKDLAWFMNFMSDRIMLGSDYPDYTIAEAYEEALRIAKTINLSEDKFRKICFENYGKVYG